MEPNKTGKWVYCPKCKIKPDRIVEVYKEIKEIRVWCEDADIYELVDSDFNDPEDWECGECGEKCIVDDE